MGTNRSVLTGNRFSLLATANSPSPKNKRKKLSNNITNQIFPSLPDITSKIVSPKFVVINSADSTKKLSDFSVFALKKAIDSISTETESVNMLRDGSLLVLTKSSHIAEKFIKTKNFGGLCTVNITYHISLNSCKGTIYDRNLISTPESEILEHLKSQGVINVYKFSKTINEKRIFNGLILLTLISSNLQQQ